MAMSSRFYDNHALGTILIDAEHVEPLLLVESGVVQGSKMQSSEAFESIVKIY